MKNNYSTSKPGFYFVIMNLLIIVALSIGSIIHKDKVTSSAENRVLTQFRMPTMTTFSTGDWGKHLEAYNKDQFIVRSAFIKIYYKFLDLLHIKERNGFVIGRDKVVLTVHNRPSTPYSLYTARNYGTQQLDAMKILTKATNSYGGKIIYLNIPHHNEWFSKKYPSFYRNKEDEYHLQRKSIIHKIEQNGIMVVRGYDALKPHENEYIYFNTDHHWTLKGSYYVYQELLKAINKNNPQYKLNYPAWKDLKHFDNKQRMVGSYLAKLGDSGKINNDHMEYAQPKILPRYVRYDDGKLSRQPLYTLSSSSYSSFMNGDKGNTVIKTNRQQLPKILYIGLSYSNTLEVLSIYSFNEVHSIDPRHYRGSISQYIRQTKPDYVAIVRDDIFIGNPQMKCKLE